MDWNSQFPCDGITMKTKINPNHNLDGNCTIEHVTRNCGKCGHGELCDVCHRHDEPRGECQECAECNGCWRDHMREEVEAAWNAVIDDCNDWKEAWRHARHAINGEWP